MLKINFYELGKIEDSMLRFAVIVSRYNDKWVYCKHKERNTWEIAGGHIEAGEAPLTAAKRELHEETGATVFDIKPICIYSVVRDTESYGLLCYAKINYLGELPDSEIEKVGFFDNEPESLTYPHIQPKLFEKVLSVVNIE